MSDTQLDTTVSQTKRISLADIAASQGATLQQQAEPVALERAPVVALSDEDQARAHEIARGIDLPEMHASSHLYLPHTSILRPVGVLCRLLCAILGPEERRRFHGPI